MVQAHPTAGGQGVQGGSRGGAAAPGGAVCGEGCHPPPRPPQGLRAWCRRPGSSTRSPSRVLTATQWRTKRRGSPPPRRAAQTPRRGILAAWCGGVAPPPRWPHSVHRAIAETPDATGAGARPTRGRSDDVDRHPRLLTGQRCLVMPQRCRRLTRPTPPRHPSCTGPSPTTPEFEPGPEGGLPRTWPDPPPLSLQAAANSERKSGRSRAVQRGGLTAHAGARRPTRGRNSSPTPAAYATQPRSFMANPACQIFVTCRILLSPSNSMT